MEAENRDRSGNLAALRARAAECIEPLIEMALAEDIGPGDITTDMLVDPEARGVAYLVAREHGVVAGLVFVEAVLRHVDEELEFHPAAKDGSPVRPNQVLGEIHGPLRAALTAERTVLNFLQALSGIATITRKFVDAVAGTGAKIYDTRKTTPGWRSLEKYAVRMGGGQNHRTGLHDAILIKDNHLACHANSTRPVAVADIVRLARSRAPKGMPVQVEVERLEQLAVVLQAKPDVILLDNMTLVQLREAVRRRNAIQSAKRPRLEASGGINLRKVRNVAETGVDRISVGALTHSAPALDLAMEITSLTPARKPRKGRG
ncbi:MAG: carboxylating nicotinate-nucleotide diphosphorylase [Phycisphaerae bacterium]|jgi:nicotinate-nucleotide pyrophosphorylase (carboxylating)|nr:carboxylating nicotinate-nucleotide diphosphorylase [Phycisphaerae bacterium]